MAVVAWGFACLRIDKMNLLACEASDCLVGAVDAYRNFGAEALHSLTCIRAMKKVRDVLSAMSPLQGFFFKGIFEWPRLRYIQ
jgi:hypothetical protein